MSVLRWFTTRLMVAAMLLAGAQAAHADSRLIVRHSDGLLGIQASCLLVGCKVQYNLGDPKGQVFLVTVPDSLDPLVVLIKLLLQPAVKVAEFDVRGRAAGAEGQVVPPSLYDQTPVSYHGSTVWNGYATQPAVEIVRLREAQATLGVLGSTTVAVIDTGVDPEHPALQPVLLTGYDFTRNRSGANEKGDVDQSTAAVLDGAQPGWVNQSTAAVLDQSTAAVLDDPKHAAFGHGTMVAGVIHLVAPQAKILPLKAFRADGSGYSSDVIRAIYYAVRKGARVINMSFSFSVPSQELSSAVGHAVSKGAIPVASVGNDGQKKLTYPAALSNVLGVASTTDWDTRASFSNYGSVVFVASPGEAIVTTYPWGTYAAAWGTSFSAPFISGTAALLLDMGSCNAKCAADFVANAQWLSDELGNGRLDVLRVLEARKAAGR